MSESEELWPIPMHTMEVVNAYCREVRSLTRHLGREPTNDEVAECLGVTAEEAGEIRAFAAQPVGESMKGEALAHIKLERKG